MGVTGLWRLIEPSGKPVPLETLENKVLAIDVSIWLHQAIKGFQDAQGAPLPNAHLLGIYHRVCKLLYFRVKPVFVFDGGVPNLKKETISKRNQQKSKKLNEAERIQKQLLTTLLKHSAVNKVLSEKAKASLITKANLPKNADKEKSENIYVLPPTELDSTLSPSDDEYTSESFDSSPSKQWDLHTIDEKSPHFKSLPADVRHEILTDLKETRKQSSWGRLHELPKQSDDFSIFQMKRLLKRNSVQVSLEEAEKEMGGKTLSLAELETLMTEQGVVTSTNSSVGRRIASDENTRYLLIKDVKKAMDEAKMQKEVADMEAIQEAEEKVKSEDVINIMEKNEISCNKTSIETDITQVDLTKDDDVEFQEDLEKAIQLSLQDVPSTSTQSTEKAPRKHNFSFLEDFKDADFQHSSESEEDTCQQSNKDRLSTVKSYMLEYSGLTPNEIAKIMDNTSNTNNIDKNTTKPNNMSESNKGATITVPPQQYDDRTVSSSITLATKLKNIVTKVCNDSDDVSSSTNKLSASEIITPNIIINNEQDHTEKVEIMSDDTSSEVSDDFLEVSETPDTNNLVSTHTKSTGFDILIKPEDSLEDDIFSDIFSGNKQSEKTSVNLSKQNTEDIKLVKEVQTDTVVTSKHKNTVLQPQNDVAPVSNVTPGSENVLNKGAIESKEDRTINVIAELIQPLQKRDNSVENKSDMQSAVENRILTTEQLEVIEQNLREEKDELIAGKLSKERMANNLTDQIYQEAQELLQLFGVPFIVAPMEAEAQCAFLEDINLTNGTITDDSDIWLFGGKTVYKNFFNQHKHVKEFRADNVQHHFKLTREQMILLALLVGSDYTVGIQGIGPVTALEILAAFPPSKVTDIQLSHQQLISGLEEFRKWLSGERAAGPGRTALRNKLKNVAVADSFPSMQVIRAYLEPTVDSSQEPFSWAKPDIVGLIQFARQKFGWSRVKSEEILKPVVKRLNETRLQRSIKDYFQTKHKIDSGEIETKMSKRVKKAIHRIGKEDNACSDEEKEKTTNKSKGRKVKATVKTKKGNSSDTLAQNTNVTTDCIAEVPEGLSSDEDIQILKKVRTQSKKKIEEIQTDVKNAIEEQIVKKPRTIASLHKKEVIPQKEKDKVDALRSKIKAIEVFRKSKKGPGYLQKRKVIPKQLKEDAELSESSSD